MRYVEMPIECPECHTEQIVHIQVRPGFRPLIGDQTVACVKCRNPFDVLVPDTIIAGPFPAGIDRSKSGPLPLEL